MEIASPFKIVSELMHLRTMFGPDGNAAYSWFTSVYVQALANMLNADKTMPQHAPSPAAIAGGFNMPRLGKKALTLLSGVLLRIGFQSDVRKDRKDERAVGLPRDSSVLVKHLIEANVLLARIDMEGVFIENVVKDYAIIVDNKSPAHFAIKWLIGPYMARIILEEKEEDSKEALSKRTLHLPSVFSVARRSREATEKDAKQLWGDTAESVEKGWKAILELFQRMRFRRMAGRWNEKRIKKLDNPGRGLVKLSQMVPPKDPIHVRGFRIALAEIAHHHNALHRDHNTGDNEKLHDLMASFIEAATTSENKASSFGCSDSPDDDDVNDGKIPPRRVRTFKDIEDLKLVIRAMQEVIDNQSALIAKAKQRDIIEDKRDVVIIDEVGRLRSEIETLRMQTAVLLQENAKSNAAMLEMSALAESYRRSYEATQVNSSSPTSKSPPQGIPPPPPPPPTNGPELLRQSNQKTLLSDKKLRRIESTMAQKEKSIDEGLANVTENAKNNVERKVFDPLDFVKIRAQLVKVKKAAAASPVLVEDKTLMATLEKALQKRRPNIDDSNDDSSADDDEAWMDTKAFEFQCQLLRELNLDCIEGLIDV